ncbi:MAG: hypothetical protein ACRDGN_04085, partial [bacterium]
MIVEIIARGKVRRAEVSPVEHGSGALRVALDEAVAVVRLDPLAGSEWWRLEVDGDATPVRLRTDEAHGRDATVLATVGPARITLEIRRWPPRRSTRTRAASGADRIEVRAP